MGYMIDQTDGEFFLAASDKPAALEALYAMWTPDHDEMMRGGGLDDGVRVSWYSWTNDVAWRGRKFDSLEAGLDDWGFAATTNDEGDVIDLQFIGEKIGEEHLMFDAIAPWVRAGSHLDFHGEDNDAWRFAFDGVSVARLSGRVVFDD